MDHIQNHRYPNWWWNIKS